MPVHAHVFSFIHDEAVPPQLDVCTKKYTNKQKQKHTPKKKKKNTDKKKKKIRYLNFGNQNKCRLHETIFIVDSHRMKLIQIFHVP